jgi:hypothetical protein
MLGHFEVDGLGNIDRSGMLQEREKLGFVQMEQRTCSSAKFREPSPHSPVIRVRQRCLSILRTHAVKGGIDAPRLGPCPSTPPLRQ